MSRLKLAIQANLEAYLRARGSGRLYSGVPFTGPDAGWPAGTPVHLVDGVWIDTGGRGELVPWSTANATEFERDLAGADAVVLGAHGFADRTLFGRLLVGRDLLARAWPAHRNLDVEVLTEQAVWRSQAYLAEGMALLRNDRTPVPDRTFVPAGLRRRPAKPSAEDVLIVRYFEQRHRGRGRLIQEVPVTDARIDALFIADDKIRGQQFWVESEVRSLRGLVADHDVEVIEAKQKLSLDVIGQVTAGAILLAHECPKHRLIRQTIVVGATADPALEWFCAKRGIRVFTPDAG